MIVDLDNLYWYQARDVLDYCVDQGLDLDRVHALKRKWASPLAMVDDVDTPWVIDIPQAHVNWLELKGLL
jgi:hypothetical protein